MSQPITQSLIMQTAVAGATGTYVVAGPVILQLVVSSSGNQSSQISICVAWDDVSSENRNFIQMAQVRGIATTADVQTFNGVVGQTVQLQHVYVNTGLSTVMVRVYNTSGEFTDVIATGTQVSKMMFRLQVTAPSVSAPASGAAWSGLALPGLAITISDTTQTVFPPLFSSLLSDAKAGDTTMTVANYPEQFVIGSQVIISQPGRMITMGRVSGSDGNVLQLNCSLNDSYTAGAVVELRRATMVGISQTRMASPSGWNFPSSTDRALVSASMRMALETRVLERQFRRWYGSRIHYLPFEQNDSNFPTRVVNEAVGTIARCEPRVAMSNVNVTSDQNAITLTAVATLLDGTGSAFPVHYSVPTQ